jgi:hypothetical protein
MRLSLVAFARRDEEVYARGLSRVNTEQRSSRLSHTRSRPDPWTTLIMQSGSSDGLFAVNRVRAEAAAERANEGAELVILSKVLV